MNRLASEPSPYLQQHAHNPVDWFPWGEEAISKAQRENKPILLSIGYATCHWCHVMEKESFEDKEIGAYLSENYVPIKVDREQRPDIDAQYMMAVQAMTGHGGWPMTLWLTPTLEPFFGGTYFPARDGDRGIGRGFLSLLKLAKEAFDTDRERVTARAHEFTQELRATLNNHLTKTDIHHSRILSETFSWFEDTFDGEYGGFGGAPKFPRPSVLFFLLRYGYVRKDPAAYDMVFQTLEAMAEGGIFDHVGGGFHRYSVDKFWLVPHFEKMLYDQAQLLWAYAEGYQISRNPVFKSVMMQTADYLLREMQDPEGGFYSATDADSEGEEGTFFVWDETEIKAVLGKHASLFSECYGVSTGGNFENKNVLSLVKPELKAANEKVIQECLAALYQRRETRPKPSLDHKISCSWNGLTIAALAKVGSVLNEPKYIGAAEKAAAAIFQHMYHGERLAHSRARGKNQQEDFLEDYVFLTTGCLELFEATGNVSYLDRALQLQDILTKRFEDAAEGGYFTAPVDSEVVLGREKPYYDGAEPSPNSMQVHNLFKLSFLLDEPELREKTEKLFSAFGAALEKSPQICPWFVSALFYSETKSTQWVYFKGDHEADSKAMRQLILERYMPFAVRMFDVPQTAANKVPMLLQRQAINGRPTVYVCEGNTCQQPMTHLGELTKFLEAEEIQHA